MSTKSDIGFVGMGEMGTRMAHRLIEAGHPVAVYDLDKDRQAAFARGHQCRSADTLAELAHGVDVVFTMVPDGRAVRNAYLEAEDGALLKGLKEGALAIDTSSSNPLHTRALGKTLAESGIRMVDAPVSGGITGAENGTLVFMLGGDDPAANAEAKEVLGILGDRIFDCGGLGNGHCMKSMNNYISATGFLAAIEGILVGREFGLEPAVMVDVLNQSTGRNFATANTLMQEMIPRTFGTKFQLGLMAKDIKIAADLAEDLTMNMPVSRQIRDLLGRAEERVGWTADHTEAVKYWELLNNIGEDGRRRK